jgi:hypothetical protein
MAKSAEARESLLSFFHATHGPIIAIISTSFARFFLPEPGTHCALEARSKSRSLHPLQASGRVSVKRLSAFSVNAQLRPVVHPTASTILPFSPSRFAGTLRKRSRPVQGNGARYPSFDWLLTRCYICPRTHSSKTQRRKKMKRLRSVHGFLVDSSQLPHPCVLRGKFDAD